MADRTRYLLAYDIREKRRLRRVHRVAKDYGEPLQYSLFVCDLTVVELMRLKGALVEEMKQTEDSVSIFDLGRPRREMHRAHRPPAGVAERRAGDLVIVRCQASFTDEWSGGIRNPGDLSHPRIAGNSPIHLLGSAVARGLSCPKRRTARIWLRKCRKCGSFSTSRHRRRTAPGSVEAIGRVTRRPSGVPVTGAVRRRAPLKPLRPGSAAVAVAVTGAVRRRAPLKPVLEREDHPPDLVTGAVRRRAPLKLVEPRHEARHAVSPAPCGAGSVEAKARVRCHARPCTSPAACGAGSVEASRAAAPARSKASHRRREALAPLKRDVAAGERCDDPRHRRLR